MTTINKKMLVDTIYEETDLFKTKKDTTAAIDAIFGTITKIISEGGKVDISGFGKFEVIDRKERTGINPSTKETITIPTTKTPKFKASKTLKDAVNK